MIPLFAQMSHLCNLPFPKNYANLDFVVWNGDQVYMSFLKWKNGLVQKHDFWKCRRARGVRGWGNLIDSFAQMQLP